MTIVSTVKPRFFQLAFSYYREVELNLPNPEEISVASSLCQEKKNIYRKIGEKILE